MVNFSMINFDELLDQSAPGYEREDFTLRQYVEVLGIERVGDLNNYRLPLSDFGRPDLTNDLEKRRAHGILSAFCVVLTALADTDIGEYPDDFRDMVRTVIEPHRQAILDFTTLSPDQLDKEKLDSIRPLADAWKMSYIPWEENYEIGRRKEL